MRKKRDKDNREFLFNARINSIKFKKLKDLTEEEANLDGFFNVETAIKTIMKINNIKNKNRWCYLVRFTKTEGSSGKKSIVFSLFRDKLLDGSKRQTIRMIFMPNYVEGEVVKIMFKNTRKRKNEVKKGKKISSYL